MIFQEILWATMSPAPQSSNDVLWWIISHASVKPLWPQTVTFWTQMFKQTFCLPMTLRTDILKSPKTFLRERVCCRLFINCKLMKAAGPFSGTVLSKFKRCDQKSPQFTQIIKHSDANASAVSCSCQATDNQEAPVVQHCSRVCVHANAQLPDTISLTIHSGCLLGSRYQVRKTPDGLMCLKVSS